jgi:hypothetical protein
MIASCEACSEDAELPFDYILDRLTGSDPTVTDYVLKVPARCLQCGAEITEKTLIGLEHRITPEQNDLPKLNVTRAESQHIRDAAYFDYPPCGFCLHTGGYFVASGTVGPLTVVR